MSKKLKVAIAGAEGKMGQVLCTQLRSNPKVQKNFLLCEEIERDNIASFGRLEASVVIDFSHPLLSLEVAKLCAKNKVAHLVCTTGFSAAQLKTLKSLHSKNKWAIVANTSLGVYAMKKASELITDLVAKVFDTPYVTESHHRMKIDAPSGTAIAIKEAVESRMPKGKKIPAGNMLSIRAGSDCGTHTLSYYGDFEELHLTHKAQDRSLFALGAFALAQSLSTKPPRPAPYTLDTLF